VINEDGMGLQNAQDPRATGQPAPESKPIMDQPAPLPGKLDQDRMRPAFSDLSHILFDQAATRCGLKVCRIRVPMYAGLNALLVGTCSK